MSRPWNVALGTMDAEAGKDSLVDVSQHRSLREALEHAGQQPVIGRQEDVALRFDDGNVARSCRRPGPPPPRERCPWGST